MAGGTIEKSRANNEVPKSVQLGMDVQEETDRLRKGKESKEKEPGVFESVSTFVKEGVKSTMEELRHGSTWEKVFAMVKIAGGIAAVAYVAKKAIDGMMSVGSWMKEKLGETATNTMKGVLIAALGASAGGLVYEAVKGKLSIAEVSKAFANGGPLEVGKLLYKKQKEGILDITKDTWNKVSKTLNLPEFGSWEQKEQTPEEIRAFGKMKPISEVYKNYVVEMKEAALDILGWAIQHKYEIGISAALLSQIKIVRTSVMAGAKMSKDIFLLIASLPLKTLKAFPVSTLFLSGAALMYKEEIKDFADVKVPENPAALKKYLQYKIGKAPLLLEKSNMSTVSNDKLDMVVSFMQGKTKWKSIEEGIKSAAVETGKDVLEAITLSPEKMVQMRNIDGLQYFSTRVARVLVRNEHLAQYARELGLFVESLESELEKGGELTKNDLKKISELSKKMGIKVFTQDGLIRYYLESEGPATIKNLGIDPSANNKEWLAKSFVIQESMIKSASKVLTVPLHDLRVMMGNITHENIESEDHARKIIERKMKSGATIAISALGVTMIEQPAKGVYHKYFLGPLRLVKNLIPWGEDFSMKEAACEYGEGILPVFMLGVARQVVTMDLGKAGFGKSLVSSVAYPIEVPKKGFKMIGKFLGSEFKGDLLGDAKVKLSSDYFATKMRWSSKYDSFRKFGAGQKEYWNELYRLKDKSLSLYEAQKHLLDAKHAPIARRAEYIKLAKKALESTGAIIDDVTTESGSIKNALANIADDIVETTNIIKKQKDIFSMEGRAIFSNLQKADEVLKRINKVNSGSLSASDMSDLKALFSSSDNSFLKGFANVIDDADITNETIVKMLRGYIASENEALEVVKALKQDAALIERGKNIASKIGKTFALVSESEAGKKITENISATKDWMKNTKLYQGFEKWRGIKFDTHHIDDLVILKDENKIVKLLVKQGATAEQASDLVGDLVNATKHDDVMKILTRTFNEDIIRFSPRILKASKMFAKGAQYLGRFAAVTGTVVSAIEAGSAGWEALSTDDADRRWISTGKAAMWTTNLAADAAGTYALWTSLAATGEVVGGTAAAGGGSVAGVIALPMIPVVAVGSNVFDSMYERTITTKEWQELNTSREKAIHEWMASRGALDSAGEKFRHAFTTATADDIAKEKEKTARKILETVLLRDDLHGVKEVPEGHIPKGYVPDKYRVMFLNALLSDGAPTTTREAEEVLAKSRSFSEVMQEREKRKERSVPYVIDGVDLLHEKFDNPTLDEIATLMHTIEEYRMKQIPKKDQETFKNMNENELVDIYCNTKLLMVVRPDLLEEGQVDLAAKISNYIKHRTNVDLQKRLRIAEAVWRSVRPSEEKLELLAKDLRKKLKLIEKNPDVIVEQQEKPKDRFVDAVYRAAKFFGYEGAPNEDSLRKFFKEDKAGVYGLYWSGKGWYMNDNFGIDDYMGPELNKETVMKIWNEYDNEGRSGKTTWYNPASWFEGTGGSDNFESRNESMYDMVTIGGRDTFSAQSKGLSRAMREALSGK